MSKISIIIPVYNTEKYLPRCLESVIKQSYKDIEIMIVNDSSLGNCEEIVKKYQEQDKRIKLINNKVNKGLFAAREVGVRASEGDYILHVDSDDWINVELCDKLSHLLDQDLELITFNTLSVKNTGIEKALWTNQGLRTYIDSTLFNALCNREFISWTMWGKLFKKDLAIDIYDKINLSEHLTMAEDLLYFFYYAYFVKTSMHVSCDGYYHDITTTSVNRVEYTVDKASLHLENLRIVISKMKNIQQFTSTDIRSKIHQILKELAQSYLIKLDELSSLDKQTIFPLLVEVFTAEILVEYISDQAQLQDNKIRFMSDRFIQKLFLKNSIRYQIVRSILLKIHSLVNRVK